MQSLSRFADLGLIETGARIYEWRGEQPGQGCLHSKFAVIDGQVTVIGSCNLDPRSLGINSEDVVIIDSAPVSRQLLDWVEAEDLPISQRITREEARKWRDPKAVAEKFKLTFGKTLEDWY